MYGFPSKYIVHGIFIDFYFIHCCPIYFEKYLIKIYQCVECEQILGKFQIYHKFAEIHIVSVVDTDMVILYFKISETSTTKIIFYY